MDTRMDGVTVLRVQGTKVGLQRSSGPTGTDWNWTMGDDLKVL